jgi:hypothetical protein
LTFTGSSRATGQTRNLRSGTIAGDQARNRALIRPGPGYKTTNAPARARITLTDEPQNCLIDKTCAEAGSRISTTPQERLAAGPIRRP